jgi:hypothetical protein
LIFIYGLYNFQTRIFYIIVQEVRSSIGTDWLFWGPILLKSPLHDVIVKVSILKFMSHLLVLELILLRNYIMLILMSNCKVWIINVVSKSFHLCWIFFLIGVIFFYDFQSKETIVEAFNTIVEPEKNVLLEVSKADYPQKMIILKSLMRL